jgi:ABC-type uncharacterized transport system substrate-binding protein
MFMVFKRMYRRLSACLFLLCLSLHSSAEGLEKPVRLMIYQGGDYTDYYKTLHSMVNGLAELGVLDKSLNIPDYPDENTGALWRWLSENASNENVVFLRDGFFSAQWSEKRRNQLREDILRKLEGGDFADMVLTLGTWSGLDLVNDRHSLPTIVMSTSNAIYSGIIQSAEDSGFDHVFASVTPDRHYKQIKIFHDLIGFKKIGVAYENTLVGKSYAAIPDLEKIAKERGFEVIPCFTQSDIADIEIAERSLMECYEFLSDKVDALYVTEQGGLLERTHKKIIDLAIKKRLPTFSQYGQDEVKQGYLLSASRSFGLFKEGRFIARAVKKVLDGERPRDIPQVFHETPDIYLNMKTAEVIGFHMNAYLLAAADQLYWRIETQE